MEPIIFYIETDEINPNNQFDFGLKLGAHRVIDRDGERGVLLNLYGDNEHYKPFPDMDGSSESLNEKAFFRPLKAIQPKEVTRDGASQYEINLNDLTQVNPDTDIEFA